jgi:hypothetical protein
MSRLSQLGAVSEAPFRPHLEHLAERGSTSLDARSPHRMMSGARAVGARCRHFTFEQLTQSQGASLRISWSVGRDGAGSDRMPPRWRGCARP